MTVTEETGEVEGFRLSPQQRHLWHQLRGGAAGQFGGGYFAAQCALLAPAELDPAALTTAAGRMLARHEILRTGFRALPGTDVPVQFIDDGAAARLRLEQVDLGEVAAGAPLEQRVGQWLAEVRQRPWLLEQPPLLRLGLARIGGGRQVLAVTQSALCADAMDVLTLRRELLAEYGAPGAAAGEEPLQYADLAEWQNELLEEATEKISARALPELPGVRPDRAAPGVAGAAFEPRRVPLPDLAPALADRARELAAAHGTSVAGVLLTCWQVLLRRLVGDGDLWLGVSCDGRSYEGLDRALGLFARDLPLAVELDPAQPFGALIEATEARWAALLERQEHFSWDRSIGAATAANFFPLGFACEDWSESLSAGAAALTVCGHHVGLERFVLRLVVGLGPAGLAAALHFDAASCDPVAVERLAGWCSRLISGLLASPDASLTPAAVDLLSAAERHHLLHDLQPAAVTPARTDICIHELIEEQAAQRPDAVAVVCGDQSLTYGELAARAAAIAAELRERGVGPDVMVGVCVDRSVELIVGILAVLEAGGAYLPLDPSYPAARLSFMLEDTAAPVLLTVRHLAGIAPVRDGVTTVLLDADVAPPAPAGTGGGAARPDGLVYVIYTSGSTGQPKGVEVEHRNLVHSTLARAATYGAAPDCYLLLSSFGFDSSVVGIFWTLCGGGTLVIPAEGRERDLHELTRLVRTHGVTHTLALPSLHAVLLRETGGAGLDSLRTVIVAGEACSRELVELHGRTLPGAALFNEYGPTEATVWSTVHRCDPAADERRVPIGRPIQNARVRVLDARQEPVPFGVPGELYVGGPGVARGYLGRAELTAERFVADPFGAPGDRLYRTGDLVRYREGGDLDFLGRTDNQVKIRGYRIELEEIEDALRAVPAVAEAAVIVRQDAGGDPRLVGYLLPADGELDGGLDDDAIREHLASRLPEYMVPAALVPLGSMPRMPNGKIDRAALGQLDEARSSGEEYVAPRSALEEALAGIWSELLGVETVGIRDNFFRLGGHSLLVTQLIFRLREVFAREVSLRAVFDRPTIEDLAALLADDAAGGDLQGTARSWLEARGQAR